MRFLVSLQIHLPVVVISILLPTQFHDPQPFIRVQPWAQGLASEHLPLQYHLLWATTAQGKSQPCPVGQSQDISQSDSLVI